MTDSAAPSPADLFLALSVITVEYGARVRKLLPPMVAARDAAEVACNVYTTQHGDIEADDAEGSKILAHYEACNTAVVEIEAVLSSVAEADMEIYGENLPTMSGKSPAARLLTELRISEA